MLLYFIDIDEKPITTIVSKNIPQKNELIRFSNNPNITYKVENILHFYTENMNYDIEKVYVICTIHQQFLNF